MSLPFDPAKVKLYEVVESNGEAIAVKLSLKTGDRLVIDGDDFTDEVKQYVLSQGETEA